MAELKIAPLRPETGRNTPARNEACALDLGWVRDVRVNLSAAERRVATLPGRRTVKKDAQAAWLLKAVTCIDLTTLNGDDTEGRVRRLCAKAKSPIRHDILEALGMADRRITTGAICVYHRFVTTAVDALAGSGMVAWSTAAAAKTSEAEGGSEPGRRSPVGLIFGVALVLGLAGYALMRFLRRKS